MQKKQKVIVIVGPTSSGKSALAVQIARKFNGEVVSADSRQVYKGLDIGTGKITKWEMKGIRHHLLDVASPRHTFTVADFVRLGRRTLSNILQNNKTPIVVGGTGFYIDALLGRILLPDVPPDWKLRAKLEKRTPEQLFSLLKKKDPRRARSIDPHNKRRLIRALEIAATLGEVPRRRDFVNSNSGLRNSNIRMIGLRNQSFDVLWIGLELPMQELEKKIAARLWTRMKQGMSAEARRLHEAGLSYKRMNQLGLEYRALAHYLRGKVSRRDMIERLTRDIRRYAKRQLTYWRRNGQIQWCNPNDRKKIVVQTQKFIGGR